MGPNCHRHQALFLLLRACCNLGMLARELGGGGACRLGEGGKGRWQLASSAAGKGDGGSRAWRRRRLLGRAVAAAGKGGAVEVARELGSCGEGRWPWRGRAVVARELGSGGACGISGVAVVAREADNNAHELGGGSGEGRWRLGSLAAVAPAESHRGRAVAVAGKGGSGS